MWSLCTWTLNLFTFLLFWHWFYGYSNLSIQLKYWSYYVTKTYYQRYFFQNHCWDQYQPKTIFFFTLFFPFFSFLFLFSISCLFSCVFHHSRAYKTASENPGFPQFWCIFSWSSVINLIAPARNNVLSEKKLMTSYSQWKTTRGEGGESTMDSAFLQWQYNPRLKEINTLPSTILIHKLIWL